MDKDEFLEMTHCDKCPCLSTDYETGGSCNLGYTIYLYWTKLGNVVQVSSDCELEIVKYLKGEYRPVKVMAREDN